MEGVRKLARSGSIRVEEILRRDRMWKRVWRMVTLTPPPSSPSSGPSTPRGSQKLSKSRIMIRGSKVLFANIMIQRITRKHICIEVKDKTCDLKMWDYKIKLGTNGWKGPQ